jgi:hypothetical protein
MQRRRNRRWPRQLEVRFWKQGEPGAPSRGVSTNISRTGIFVRTNFVLPSGSRLRLEIGHHGRTIAVEGLVMRAIKSPAHLQTVMPSGMGVRWLQPEELLGELLPGVDLGAEEVIPGDVAKPRGSTVVPGSPSGAPPASAPSPRTSSPPSDEHTPTTPGPPTPPPRKAPEITGAAVFPLRFRDHEQFRRVFERDVQTGGLFISTERPAALDTVIQVEVGVEGSPAAPVRLQARVVHRMEPPPGSTSGNLLVGMGVQFLDVGRAVEQLRALLQ